MALQLPFSFDFRRSALVVVDMQNDFVRESAPLEVPDARTSIKPINSLITAWRGIDRPVVFTRFQAGETPSLLWTWSPQIHSPILQQSVGEWICGDQVHKSDGVSPA